MSNIVEFIPIIPWLFWIWMWASDQARYAFILTLIDCFTRKVPYWEIAFSVKSDQVKKAWEYIILSYLQPCQIIKNAIDVEIRNDNDTRFAYKDIRGFFK